MSVGSPAIACIGLIGKRDNPLHMSLFPPGKRDILEFTFLLNSSLDIFEQRIPTKTADHDFGLLQVLDERLAMYGWLTNTGVRFVVVVDMEGRENTDGRPPPILGIRDADLKPAFRAIHAAYIRLMRNPFFDPEDDTPQSIETDGRVGGMQIGSPRFIEEMERIGATWYPGITVI